MLNIFPIAPFVIFFRISIYGSNFFLCFDLFLKIFDQVITNEFFVSHIEDYFDYSDISLIKVLFSRKKSVQQKFVYYWIETRVLLCYVVIRTEHELFPIEI